MNMETDIEMNRYKITNVSLASDEILLIGKFDSNNNFVGAGGILYIKFSNRIFVTRIKLWVKKKVPG